MKTKIESAGRDAKRLVRGGKTVGMLLRLSDDRWGIYDAEERRLTMARYRLPSLARDLFDKIQPPTAESDS